MQTLIVTGAAGFIGSAVCRYLREKNLARVIGVDAMTFAASRESLGILANDPLFSLIESNVANAAVMGQLFLRAEPDGVIHLAAETHEARSVQKPADFLHANIVGTFSLLETTRVYLNAMSQFKRESFRFLYASANEAYGEGAEALTEESPYDPRSPYAATKAGGEHLARAWHQTYGVPVLTAVAGYTYGPLQYPSHLLPFCLFKALNGKPVPLPNRGETRRDWLHISDLARALILILGQGRIGEKYHVGGAQRKTDLDVAQTLCAYLDAIRPDSPYVPHQTLIAPDDSPAYAPALLDGSKLKKELNWAPEKGFEEGLRETVDWYINNQLWCKAVRTRQETQDQADK